MTRRIVWESACFTSLTAATILAGWLLLSFAGPAHAWPKGGNGGGKGNGGGDDPPPPPPDLPTFTYQSLGTLGGNWSNAEAMNNLGHVVGDSERADGTYGPYLYATETGMIEVNRLIPNSMLQSPKNLAWGPDINGNGGSDLYVASGGDYRVIVYDGQTGEYVPTAFGGLNSPHGITVEGGTIFVCSRGTGEVLAYDALGNAAVFISGLGNPIDIAFFDGDAYVINGQTHEVLAFDGVTGAPLPNPVFVGDDPATPEDESGGLTGGHALLFDGGVLYVSSGGTNEILGYDAFTGEFLGVFIGDDPATPEDESGGLLAPRMIAFGPDGDVYVASAATDEILRYDEFGEFQDVFVTAGDGGLAFPIGLVFDSDDNLLITSRDTHEVLVYEGPFSSDPGNFIDAVLPDSGVRITTANDINDAGQIVGGWDTKTDKEGRTYRLTPPQAGEEFWTFEDLGTSDPVPASVLGLATGINQQGDVTGYFLPAENARLHAFLWKDGNFIDLGTPGGAGDMRAYAVNDRDGNGDVQVVGVSSANANPRAFRFDTGTSVWQDLGTLVSDDSGQALVADINDSGQAVGRAHTEKIRGRLQSSKNNAYRFTDGIGMENLGTLHDDSNFVERSYALALNNFGDVVGRSQTDSGGSDSRRAFLFTDEFGLLNLDELVPAATLTAATDINDLDQICGPRERFAGEVAYILTPQ